MNRTEQALVNMGFDLRNVRDGLRMHGNDPKRTLEWLSDLTLDAETGGGSNGATKKRPRKRLLEIKDDPESGILIPARSAGIGE